MSKPFKFPVPGDYPAKHPALLCPSERVLKLYNQENPESAQRVAKKVKQWFGEKAHAAGWAGVRFLPEMPTQHSAGAILWQMPKVQVTFVQGMLVLGESDEETDE